LIGANIWKILLTIMKPINDCDQNAPVDAHITAVSAALTVTTALNVNATNVASDPNNNPDIYLVYPESPGFHPLPYGQH
jgi:hypothetical protein